MLYKSNLRNEAGTVNQHCTMEADTISKHGRSLKSQMSGGKFSLLMNKKEE